MIDIKSTPNSQPYLKFKEEYDLALASGQKNIEAACLSTYHPKLKELSSRFINIKYVIDSEFHFFSNYTSAKADAIRHNNKVSIVFFWNNTNTQIRIKADIETSNLKFSDEHFQKRSLSKNALAISSNQSSQIENFEMVKENYKSCLEHLKTGVDIKRPDYWGGYKFIPFYFEFWKGNENRINHRQEYSLIDGNWISKILQP